jgi:hypothetical protein
LEKASHDFAEASFAVLYPFAMIICLLFDDNLCGYAFDIN